MKKILIVEDDPIAAKLYSEHLIRAGYEVEIARNGVEGLTRLDQTSPDGFLIDFMMPEMNGLDLVRAIRAKPQFSSAPVIVCSNAVLPAVLKEAEDAGVTLFFNKSALSPTQLVQAFESIQVQADPSPSPARTRTVSGDFPSSSRK